MQGRDTADTNTRGHVHVMPSWCSSIINTYICCSAACAVCSRRFSLFAKLIYVCEDFNIQSISSRETALAGVVSFSRCLFPSDGEESHSCLSPVVDLKLKELYTYFLIKGSNRFNFFGRNPASTSSLRPPPLPGSLGDALCTQHLHRSAAGH